MTYIVWLHASAQENGLLVQPVALLIMHPMGQCALHTLTTYTKTIRDHMKDPARATIKQYSRFSRPTLLHLTFAHAAQSNIKLL